MAIQLLRGSATPQYLCLSQRSMFVDPSQNAGITRGDESKSCSMVSQLQAGDTLRLAYYVHRTDDVPGNGSTYGMGSAWGVPSSVNGGQSLYAVAIGSS